ncbi:MAG: EF-P 5-aminopentanol modification-associated protein YfmF [Butyricicoccus sp.]
MNQTRTRLAEGVHLTCLTTGQYKSAVLSVGFALPLTQDNTYAALLPQVLRRGTARLPDMNALGAELDSLYGARILPLVRKSGDALVIGMLADVIDEAYVPAGENLTARLAGLLHALWYQPYQKDGLLCPDYTAAEGANLADKIAAQKNETRSYAMRRAQEILCAGEPYSWNEYGQVETAHAADAQTLTRVWQDVVTSAPIELFYCGSLEPDAVADCFHPFCTDTLRRTMPVIRPHGANDTVRTVTEEMAVTQGKLSLGFRTGLTGHDAAYPALMLFSTVFGGYTGSRLFRQVREKMSLCYYASSSLDKLKGIMLVASGIENTNFDVARDEILRQLADLQAGNLSDEELEAARRTLLNQLRTMQDSPLSLEHFFQSQAVGGLTYDLDMLMERISTLTRDDVLAAGRGISLDTVYFLKGVAQG